MNSSRTRRGPRQQGWETLEVDAGIVNQEISRSTRAQASETWGQGRMQDEGGSRLQGDKLDEETQDEKAAQTRRVPD